MKKQCSELFDKVFDSHSGGCYRECACGRIHFDTSDNGWDWGVGELEEFIRKHKVNPEKYIDHDGTVCCITFGGVEVVYGCVCDIADKWERLIISEENRLAEYLRGKAKAKREEADRIDIDKD